MSYRNNTKWTLYELVDPRNSKLIYVGITSHRRERYRQHCRGETYSTSKWIQELRKAKLKPIMNIVRENLLTEKAYRAEADHRRARQRDGYTIVGWEQQTKKRRARPPKKLIDAVFTKVWHANRNFDCDDKACIEDLFRLHRNCFYRYVNEIREFICDLRDMDDETKEAGMDWENKFDQLTSEMNRIIFRMENKYSGLVRDDGLQKSGGRANIDRGRERNG